MEALKRLAREFGPVIVMVLAVAATATVSFVGRKELPCWCR